MIIYLILFKAFLFFLRPFLTIYFYKVRLKSCLIFVKISILSYYLALFSIRSLLQKLLPQTSRTLINPYMRIKLFHFALICFKIVHKIRAFHFKTFIFFLLTHIVFSLFVDSLLHFLLFFDIHQ